ncbi:hypothetical protein [Marinobacter shengliensis]|uniref:hypothetical protein n=1 Tax=Marinobacter shengliensis TaxID=1389223 RepID=UPI0011097B25|nr:hypothetical protein [Marinobacter shengliensis]
MSKRPMVPVYVALALILANAFGSLIFAAYSGWEINTSTVLPRLGLVGFLCAMVYMEKNWARLTVGILAAVAAIGSASAIAIHFYTSAPGNPHLSLYLQVGVFLISAILLLFPKSVRQHFKAVNAASNPNHITNAGKGRS